MSSLAGACFARSPYARSLRMAQSFGRCAVVGQLLVAVLPMAGCFASEREYWYEYDILLLVVYAAAVFLRLPAKRTRTPSKSTRITYHT